MPLQHRRRIAITGQPAGRARRREVTGIEGGMETGVQGPPIGALIGCRGVGNAMAPTAVVPVAVMPRGDASPFIGRHPLAVFTLVVVPVTVAVFLGLGSVPALGGMRWNAAAGMPSPGMGDVQAAAEGEMNHRGEGREQADDDTHLGVHHYSMVSVRRNGRSRILVVSPAAASMAAMAIMAKAISVAEKDWAIVAGGAVAGK